MVENLLPMIPEIDLPDSLELSCPEIIYSWVEENMAGLKYINVEEELARHDYNRITQIKVQEKPSHVQRPSVKSEDLVHQIYLVLQYKLESTDQEVKARIVIYKNDKNGRNKPVTKHVTVGTDITDEKSSRVYNPDRINGDLVSTQMQYIQQLQDANAGLLEIATQIIKPLSDQNERLMTMASNIMYGQVEMRRLDLQAEALRNAEELEHKVRIVELQEKEATKNKAMDLLYKSGGLKIIMEAGANLLNKKKPEPVVPPPKEPEKTPEEVARETQEDLMERMKKEPLRTHLALFYKTLTEVEKNKGQVDVIKEKLSEEAFNKFVVLIQSENEKEAIENLKDFSTSLNSDDIKALGELEDILDEYQNKIVQFVLNFDTDE